jgi:hypothetical protein
VLLYEPPLGHITWDNPGSNRAHGDQPCASVRKACLEWSPILKEITDVTDESYTVDEFCAVEKISRGFLYKLWKEGKGPRSHRIGAARRISHEARTDWRRGLEATSNTVAA